jgi:phosphotransferase system  glucose/maltose/N-acetylglucosamine-specific IIC component
LVLHKKTLEEKNLYIDETITDSITLQSMQLFAISASVFGFTIFFEALPLSWTYPLLLISLLLLICGFIVIYFANKYNNAAPSSEDKMGYYNTVRN